MDDLFCRRDEIGKYWKIGTGCGDIEADGRRDRRASIDIVEQIQKLAIRQLVKIVTEGSVQLAHFQ